MINSRKLSDLRPDVRANVELLLEECKKQGLKVLITQTLRDNEYQAMLYAKGRTTPGPIVTNSKVTTFHGVGLAIDFCENVPGREYADLTFFKNVATIAKYIGFSWGGDWKSFQDRPHLQWDAHGKYTGSMIKMGMMPPTMPKYERKGDTVSVSSKAIAKDMSEDDSLVIMTKARKLLAASKKPPEWAEKEFQEAIDLGITDGSRPNDLATRAEVATMIKRAVKGGK